MTNTEEILNTLKMMALSLEQHETTYREVCPFCQGGDNSDRGSFSITRTPDRILYHCFRAKCPSYGSIPVSAVSASLDYHVSDKPDYEPVHYYRDLSHLPPEMVKTLWDRFGLTEAEISSNGFKWAGSDQRVYMPVYNALGENTGAVLRDYTGVEKKKTLLYHWRPSTKSAGHWPRCDTSSVVQHRPLVLVEDIVSSIRVARHCPAVALIGTEPSVELIKYLVPRYPRVVLALDPDAYGRAMKHWRTYGLYFDKFQPIKLVCDPKDMTHSDLKEVLDHV